LVGGRRAKFRKGELYGVKRPYGFDITCQEQPGRTGGRVHTHVWIENKENPECIVDLYMYITWNFERYPQNTSMFALVRGWALSDDETVFEGPDILYELIIDRKLSKTHIDHLCDWLDDVLYEFLTWRGMVGLFGEDEE